MKKLIKSAVFICIFSALSLPALFATDFSGDLLSKPHRYFEIGVDAALQAGNSNFGLSDIFKKNIVLDLKQIADDTPDGGFSFALHDKEEVFANLNISSRFRFSLFTNVEVNSNLNVEKELFDILGTGLSRSTSKDIDVEGFADVFANIGLSFQTIIKNYGVKITPTYCVPLVYVPSTTATAKLKTASSGEIRAEAEADIDIYTAVSMHDFMENGKSYDNLHMNYGDILSNGGFDLSLEVERNWLDGFNAGLYTRIPIIAGRLDYKMSTRVWAYAYETNVLGYLNDTESHDSDYGHDDFTYSEDTIRIYRPFKLGLNATYMPFGQWFKIQPMIGFALREPYSSNISFYPEYALDLRLSLLWRIFNFNLGTAYQNKIFQQRFGFSLNLRALEITAQASLCGTSFVSSFTRKGYGAYVGVRMGF
ncbi:MAG: hypothetical protein K5873_07350 [Treponema sp.]|nr:hypothetical protein [Treponema sp.]